MGTRETQNKIIETAIALFNEGGASAVSTNRIAEKANVSKGNLHYHFRSKEEIILIIWRRMEDEIALWTDDDKEPTIQHMAEMMLRQYRLIWRYRFFYRELNTLLDRDPELKYRFKRLRKSRMEKVHQYFLALIKNGVIRKEVTEEELKNLITISWMVSDFWLSFIAVEKDKINTTTMQEGYKLILQLFNPIMTEQARREAPESFWVFSVED